MQNYTVFVCKAGFVLAQNENEKIFKVLLFKFVKHLQYCDCLADCDRYWKTSTCPKFTKQLNGNFPFFLVYVISKTFCWWFHWSGNTLTTNRISTKNIYWKSVFACRDRPKFHRSINYIFLWVNQKKIISKNMIITEAIHIWLSRFTIETLRFLIFVNTLHTTVTCIKW